MNMLQALGVAAAGLATAVFSSTACAEGQVLSRVSALTELAATLEQSYGLPDVAERYVRGLARLERHAALPDAHIHNHARL